MSVDVADREHATADVTQDRENLPIAQASHHN
jgi:hypothetical protein